MYITLKIKTLDAQTHEFTLDNEITVRDFKNMVAAKTKITPEQQRIIYCGRVLADDKKLSEFDVDGKVLHVAERPPPGLQRNSSPLNIGSNSSEPSSSSRFRPGGNMRNSPLFRALDGMVVGTMAIPVNGVSNGPMGINPFQASSSFCMNRIAVARHMLDCANNIAAYLEEPSRGLNNTSLDILARGRWTMESTVVEGAVSAAFRRNGNANVTVMQLPTVFGSNEGENTDNNVQAMPETLENSNGDSDRNNAIATVVFEDILEDVGAEEGAASNAPSNVAQAGSFSSSSTGPNVSDVNTNDSINDNTTNANDDDNNLVRRRTGTRVLAEVIDQWRNVQTRLNPFIQQYYDILNDEPAFEDATLRESAQRIFDRVSEAFHYLSHAQHAISDLMLDLSQPTPRYLTCRPILVEQSSYVSSNNYLSAAAANAAAAALREQQQNQALRQSRQARNETVTPTTAAMANASSSGAGATQNITTESSATGMTTIEISSTATDSATDTVTDTDSAENSATETDAEGAAVTTRNIGSTLVEDPMDEPPNVQAPTINDDNPQVQMARLIQAVVNVAPADSEFHLHINAPGVVSFGVPPTTTASSIPNTSGGELDTQQQRRIATPNRNRATGNQARVNTATLPTTSTQTRSTSRPQLQIGTMPAPGWNGRFIPANVTSAFDRFLPCSSHHIRETDSSTNNGIIHTPITPPHNSNFGAPRSARMSDLVGIRPPATGANANATATTSASTSARVSAANLIHLRNFLSNSSMPTSSSQMTNQIIQSSYNDNRQQRSLRTQLLNFANEHIFGGQPINEENIPASINRAISWFDDAILCFLPQYEKPEYNAMDSMHNILRCTLKLFIDLIKESEKTPQEFEARAKEIGEQFITRLYSVLRVCVGQDNADIYWGQLMRLLLVAVRTNFTDEALRFLRVYINPDLPTRTDAADAEQFIVLRAPEPELAQFMDADVDMVDEDLDPISISNLGNAIDIRPRRARRLPSVDIGSESWHNFFPNDWVPVIAGDIEAQNENATSEPAYSDAYISGMSAKRRKVIQQSKNNTDIKSLVTDSIQMAIQNSGQAETQAPADANQQPTTDEIVEAISNEVASASICMDTIRNTVRERLEDDPDYKPEKFPKIRDFLNK